MSRCQRIDSLGCEWYVLDTAEGRLVGRAEIEGCQRASVSLRPTWLDPSGRRLYHLFEESRTPVLEALDLTTGAAAGRAVLEGVRTGTWQTMMGNVRVLTYLRPGVDLSPDGRRLAVLHADEDALTLVDTERLEVIARRPLLQAASWHERLTEWLGLRPRTAYAKCPGETREWSVHFASDGRRLYASGTPRARCARNRPP